MCVKTKKLILRLCVALLTFSASVAVTIFWVLPSYRTARHEAQQVTKKPPEIQIAEGWKTLDVRKKVKLALPRDMKSVEPLGDSERYREAYENDELSLVIVYDLLAPELRTESERQAIYTCERHPSVLKDPTYHESTLHIDGRRATLGINNQFADKRVVANLCFPVADNMKVFGHCGYLQR